MKKTLFECDVECVADDAMEGVLRAEDNSIPLKASFYLEDVEMWKETGDPDYPCRVYVYTGKSYGLWKVNYKEFSQIMRDALK